MSEVFFVSNLKVLRNRKKLSQDELAIKLGMTRSKIAHSERGKAVSPPIEDLLKFSSFYKITVDTLLQADLNKMTEQKIQELEAGNRSYTSGGHLRVLSVTVDSKNKENVEFVPLKAKAGYLNGFNDPEYISSLPKFSLPHLTGNKTFRIFPTEGDSMFPFPENCLIISEYVEDWTVLKNTPCVVIMGNEQTFLFKMVTNKLDQSKSLLLQSLNSRYKDVEVFAGDILEVWKYHSHISNTIPAAATSIDELLQVVNEIKTDIKHLQP